jgi:hypothetical protein
MTFKVSRYLKNKTSLDKWESISKPFITKGAGGYPTAVIPYLITNLTLS